MPPGQDAMHGLATEVNSLPITQQLAQVSVVGPGVGGGGQLHHHRHPIVGHGVVGSAASVAVGQCGGTLLPIGRQDPPGMAFTHPQKIGRPG